MKNIKKHYVASLLFPMLLLAVTGCSSTSASYDSSIQLDDNTESVEIILSGDDILADNVGVYVSDSILTITAGGTYLVSGDLDDGQIIIDAPEKDVEIILSNASINNSSGPAIYVKEAEDVDVALAENTNNYLSDGSNYDGFDWEEDAPNAVIYSMSDLDMEGANGATLTIEGNYNDGIVSKDDLEIKDIEITLTAVDDGLRGKDSVEIKDSTLTVDAGGDAVKSDNDEDDEKGIITVENSNLTITAGDDGLNGTSKVEILSGNIDILESFEGIEAKNITIYDGTISIVSSDDGINISDSSAGLSGGSVLPDASVSIYGGYIIMNTGGDGFDSNGTAVMTDGTLIVNGPSENKNGAIDVNGTFDISGGTLIAVGSSGMAETPSETSSQYTIQVNFDEVQAAGTDLSLVNEEGEEIFSFTPEKEFQSITYSSDSLIQGETYSMLVNGDVYTSLDVESIITKYGEASNMMRDKFRN